MKSRILITGGAGFIGSHLAEELLRNGAHVTILDNLTTGNIKNFQNIASKLELVEGDIRDRSMVSNLVSKNDAIIHLAAALGVANIMHSPIESMSINILGSEVVLSSASKFNKRIK